MESVARACHELRGPLTAVRLGLEGSAGNGALTPDRLRAIDLELGRAALVLDDLDAVRTRRGWSRPPEAIDLSQLVSDSVEALRPIAAAHGVSLRTSWSGDARTVWGDRLRLAQVTGNLIANAIEHGGGVVEVHGHGDRMRARVEVSDSGPGLPAPVAELVRAGSRGRGGRGRRGRGLAIAAAVAADQGGRLAVAPSVRGARLVLELPAGRGAAGQGPAGRSRAGWGSAGWGSAGWGSAGAAEGSGSALLPADAGEGFRSAQSPAGAGDDPGSPRPLE
jgi:signal transduction histidine kinase